MSIYVGDILRSVSHSIHEAYVTLRRERIPLDIQEVEIRINLNVELDGEPDEELRERGCLAFFIDREMLEERRMGFRRVGTVRCDGKVSTNFEFRATFTPREEHDEG